MAKTRTSTKPTASTKPTTVSAATLLGGLSQKGSTKSKSTTPQVNITDETQLEAVRRIIDAKQAMKQAESLLDMAEGAFREDATILFEDCCRKDGTLHTAVRFMGIDETGIIYETRPLSLQFIQARRCKKMTEGDASDPLHSAFGEDFDDLFAPQRTVEIDTSKLTDDQIGDVIKAMQGVLGDSFDAAVSVEALIMPKEAFFGKRILDARIRAKADNAVADGYAVPFAPSFKL